MLYDSCVFQILNLHPQIANGLRLNGPTIDIQCIDVHECSLIMLVTLTITICLRGASVPYIYQHYYFKHSSTWMAVEQSFGILKGMWHI